MAQASASATEVVRHVALDKEGRAVSRRWHRYQDCPMYDPIEAEGTVTEREASLLGLKECAVCAKRAEGGPALELLEGFFGEDWPSHIADATTDNPRDMARACIDYLRERNAFIAIRKPKSEEASE